MNPPALIIMGEERCNWYLPHKSSKISICKGVRQIERLGVMPNPSGERES